jgi:hypothetical protein
MGVYEGALDKKRTNASIKPLGVFFSRIEPNYEGVLEPSWKTFVETDFESEAEKTSHQHLVFMKLKPSARIITEDNGLMTYHMQGEGKGGFGNAEFRFDDISSREWDGMIVNMHTTKFARIFQFWDCTTAAIWNETCLDECVAYEAVPAKEWTYIDHEINLKIQNETSTIPIITEVMEKLLKRIQKIESTQTGIINRVKRVEALI